MKHRPTEEIAYIDGNWSPVKDEQQAVFRIVTVFDDDGTVLYRRRESLGERKGRTTYSTDPRAGAIMREGHHGNPMSNPKQH